MNSRSKAFLKLAVAVALAAVAIALVARRVGSFWQTGEQGARVWFYDQSEKRLYPVPTDIIPPHSGIGGKSGDGVRAIVVTFRPEQNDSHKQRIAYLETYAPELKQLLERVRSANATRRKYAGAIPSRDSDSFQTNTLVKLLEDGTWSPTSSPEGQQTMSSWRSWRGPDGQPPVVCVP